MRHRLRVVLLVVGAAALIAINAFVLTHREASLGTPPGGETNLAEDLVQKGESGVLDGTPEIHEDVEDHDPPEEQKV